jgi:hypothetical protein
LALLDSYKGVSNQGPHSTPQTKHNYAHFKFFLGHL